MFFPDITGTVTELIPNDQTMYQSVVMFTVPVASMHRIEAGTLIAARNLSPGKEKRYTILQLVNSFPVNEAAKKTKDTVRLRCAAVPIGVELTDQGAKKGALIRIADTYAQFEADAFVLDDESTVSVIHHIAPESRVQENGSRINVGTYATNPNITAGLDSVSLLRGNMAVISARPRARTTITNNLISSLLHNASTPLHVVYCDVNNQGTLSLINLLAAMERASILCLNDKFVPASVFSSLKNPADKQLFKRASLDFLDMMILPSVLESRRHELVYAISGLLRANKITIYRPNEQTVMQFIADIRTDILDGATEESRDYIVELLDGIVSTYGNERFGDKNTREIMEMIDEFSQDSKNHTARRTLYDLRTEIQAVYESYSKDIAAQVRKSTQDIVQGMNDDSRSSLLIVQAQKTTDMLRFVTALLQTIVEERLRRLKVKVPILFIFNNMDESVIKSGAQGREQSSDRFADAIQMLLTSGRRHGLGFCVALESAASLDPWFARKIQSYFIGPIPFMNEPKTIADMLNVSEDLVRPAVNYEDGRFLFTSADSPYHRRVPLPISTTKNTETVHAFLDGVAQEQERKRVEFQAQEEERRKRWEDERRVYEERRRKEEEDRRRTGTETTQVEPPSGQDEPSDGDEPDTEKPDRRGKRGRRTHGAAETSSQQPIDEPMTEEEPPGDDADLEHDATVTDGAPEVGETAAAEKKTSRRRRGGKKHQRQEGTPGGASNSRNVNASKPESDRPEPTQQDALTFATSRFGGYEEDDGPTTEAAPASPAIDSGTGEPPARSGDTHKKGSRRRGHRRGGSRS